MNKLQGKPVDERDKVVIFGGAGFIGSHLTEELRACAGCEER